MEIDTQLRRDRVKAGESALMRAYPDLNRMDAHRLAEIVVGVAQEIHDPSRERAARIVQAAGSFVESYQKDRDIDGVNTQIALRAMMEAFAKDTRRPQTWNLVNKRGMITGTFTGYEDEYRKLQGALDPDRIVESNGTAVQVG